MTAHKGIVLHIMEGTLPGTTSWFNNSASQASSHFGVGKDGTILQYVDTKDRAWAEASGNSEWISIENEGNSGDSLTDAQLKAVASIVKWAHTEHGIPFQSTDSTSGSGLGWHGMGGTAWGNHPDCPGTPIKNQRSKILSLANPPKPKPVYAPFPGVSWFKMGRKSSIVQAMHNRLVAVGCNKYKTKTNEDVIGSGDVASYEAWQRKCGFTGKDATWPPGKTTWDKLQVPGQG